MYIVVFPYTILYRILKENRIFAGLWYGSVKPNMSIFLKPMAQSLKQLYDKGSDIIAIHNIAIAQYM